MLNVLLLNTSYANGTQISIKVYKSIPTSLYKYYVHTSYSTDIGNIHIFFIHLSNFMKIIIIYYLFILCIIIYNVP